jgi:hypothetical protein
VKYQDGTICEGVDKGFAGSKFTYSKTYPPPSGKKENYSTEN